MKTNNRKASASNFPYSFEESVPNNSSYSPVHTFLKSNLWHGVDLFLKRTAI